MSTRSAIYCSGMSNPVAYTVRASLPDAATAEKYLGWLVSEHLSDLLAAGAERAEAVMLEDPDGEGRPVCESRYLFASREAYERYIAQEAPRLRARGAEVFPPETSGIRFERSVGMVMTTG